MDRAYTAFRLADSMGELLTTVNKYEEFMFKLCFFAKSEICCCAETIQMQIPKQYLDIHKDIFKIEGAVIA